MTVKHSTPGRLRANPPHSAAGGIDNVIDFSSLENPIKPQNKKDPAPPKTWICQLAVALTQTAFVVGSVYLKSGISQVDSSRGEHFHPIVYAFGREVTAGPILYSIAWLSTGATHPAWPDAGRVVALGACMFLSQLFYIIGIELSGVVVATCMQPAIPVFTVLLGVLLKMETASVQKVVGIIMAVSGAVCMVLGGVMGGSTNGTSTNNSSNSTKNSIELSTEMTLGNTCLLINTFAMASYYILSKKLLGKYSPAQVSAWAYIVAASLMGVAAATFTSSPDWHFPKSLLLPLAYWVLICSVGGYYIVTWAMCYLPASQVASFQCLQPFLGSLLAFLVLHEKLSWWDGGAVGVLAGLVLVSTDKKDVGWGGAGMMTRVRSAIARTKSRAGMALQLGLPSVKEVE